MKTNILLLGLILCACACNKPESTTQTPVIKEPTSPLVGVWEMTDRYLYEKGQISDSMEVKDATKNVKIFTPTRYMWSGRALPDQKEYFGYGRYEWTDSTFTTYADYYSRAMVGHSKKTTMAYHIKDNIYTQIHSDSTGPYYAEKYRRIE